MWDGSTETTYWSVNIDVMAENIKSNKTYGFGFLFVCFSQERTVTIRRQTVGGFGLSIKVGWFFWSIIPRYTKSVFVYS